MSTVDPRSEELAAAVGRCTSAWSQVEIVLCMCFARAVNPDFTIAATAAFWSIESFRGKLEVTGAAIRAALTPHAYAIVGSERREYLGNAVLDEKWGRLEMTLRKASKVRNSIAHGSLRVSKDLHEDGSVGRVSYFVEAGLGRPVFIPPAIGPERKIYDLRSVEEEVRKFKDVARQLESFAEALYQEIRLGSSAVHITKP